MNVIKAAIERPIAVVAAVILIVLFGLVALTRIPIQLAPDVRQPVLKVQTNCGGAPPEIEREILIQQEDALKGLEGVLKTTSTANSGRGEITLEFGVGADIDRAFMLTANRLDRVGDYPDEAGEPQIETSGTEDNAIAWFVLRRVEGVDRPIHEFGDFVNDVVKDRIERVPGVSRVNVFGGSSRELRVTVDPERMARYQLTVPQVARTLRAESAAISAGDVEEGKRRYAVRTEGELDTVDDVRAVVLRTRTDPVTGAVSRVTVGDIADVRFDYKDPTARIRVLGESAIAMNAVREGGANVIETMTGIRQAVADLNAGALPNAGLGLLQVYDETIYINSAIDLVQQNIWVGGALAAMILLLFLRSPRATLIVSIAIPISVVGAFVAMAALGRSLNVISLAGIAFAVGMVVDAAIVVLENIYKRRERGLDGAEAAYEGASQVWGAIFVSALTTVMVFIPILIRDLEISQLFRDIAVAISVSVLLSLIVSVTLIPALASRLFRDGKSFGRPIHMPVIDDIARGAAQTITAVIGAIVRRKALGALVVSVLVTLAGLATLVLAPKLEYLPSGNRNLLIGFILPPPGYNLQTVEDTAKRVEDAVRPYWDIPDNPVAAPEGAPLIERFFFVAVRNITIVGAVAADPSRVAELKPILTGPVFREPGTFGVISQPSIFGRSLGGSRSISLDISGPDLEGLIPIAQQAFGMAAGALPREEGNNYRPRPALSLGQPEVRLNPDRGRLADNGVSVADFGATIDAFNDGLRATEITVDGDRLDLTLAGPGRGVDRTQDVEDLPVVTGGGEIVPAGLLANIEVTSGPTAIRRIDGLRTITIDITPSDAYPIEEAVDILRAQVVEPLRAQGLPPGVTLRFSGAVDKLNSAWDAMVWDLALAIIIVFLVMAVLFESFVYPLVILATVPLAAVGGILGLWALNLFVDQKLDMLTLLGFVILIGIVVNNAILLVDQSLAHMRAGLAPDDAILAASKDRLRPIFMSTLTSVFGMLPLVLFPGAGSELYRGLGSVVVGGLSLSAILTLLATPPLASFAAAAVERRRVRTPAPAGAPAE